MLEGLRAGTERSRGWRPFMASDASGRSGFLIRQLSHQPLRHQHEYVLQRRLFIDEGDKAAVGVGELAEEALEVGVFAVNLDRAAAVVHLNVADLGLAADEADARFGVTTLGLAELDVGNPIWQ